MWHQSRACTTLNHYKGKTYFITQAAKNKGADQTALLFTAEKVLYIESVLVEILAGLPGKAGWFNSPYTSDS